MSISQAKYFWWNQVIIKQYADNIPFLSRWSALNEYTVYGVFFKDNSYVICGWHHCLRGSETTESSQTEQVLFLDKELSIFRCLSDGYYVTLLDCATWFV